MNTNEGALGHLHFNHYGMILSEAPCPPNYEMSQTHTTTAADNYNINILHTCYVCASEVSLLPGRGMSRYQKFSSRYQ